jgi:hypothetical protein
MKILHTLKTSWLILAMIVAVVIGETVAWQVSRAFDLRFPAFAVGAVSVGLVAFIVSLIYDGTD